jgi:hypothetical protein
MRTYPYTIDNGSRERLTFTGIHAERDTLATTVLPKSPLGEAVRYLTNQWGALQRFVEDGHFRIDRRSSIRSCRAARSSTCRPSTI